MGPYLRTFDLLKLLTINFFALDWSGQNLITLLNKAGFCNQEAVLEINQCINELEYNEKIMNYWNKKVIQKTSHAQAHDSNSQLAHHGN